MIILTNAYLDDNDTININGKIVDSRTLKTKKGPEYYIKFQDSQFDRVIEIQVDKPYPKGGIFNKTMKIGKWGLLYAEN